MCRMGINEFINCVLEASMELRTIWFEMARGDQPRSDNFLAMTRGLSPFSVYAILENSLESNSDNV